MSSEVNTTYDDYARQNGTVTIDGTEYALLYQPELSNRLFPGGWQDAAEGGEYISEWEAPCASREQMSADDWDRRDNTQRAVWQFPAVKGQEPEDGGDWPWSDENAVSLSPAIGYLVTKRR